jgi:hypothetical protein
MPVDPRADKGLRDPADPPKVEEIVTVMRTPATTRRADACVA